LLPASKIESPKMKRAGTLYECATTPRKKRMRKRESRAMVAMAENENKRSTRGQAR